MTTSAKEFRCLLAILVTLCAPACHVEAQPSPSFPIRGVLPWHNFLSGPSAWNLEDYEKYLDECEAMKINFIGFHTYTGGAQRYITYVEPLIKIEYKNIIPEAYLDNSLTARWGYEPRAIRDFAYNTAEQFHQVAPAFGSDCSILSTGKEEQYRCTQELMANVIRMAHARGMQVALGFEFGVHPPEFFSLMEDGLYWEGTGALIPNPTHYQAIEILHATIDNIVATYPDIDWIWLWLNEHSFMGFDVNAALKDGPFRSLYDTTSSLFAEPGTSPGERLIGVWALHYIRLAHDYIEKVAPGKKIVVGGWGGSNQLPAILRGLDRGLPTDIVFSCLNPGLGQFSQPSFFSEIARHRKFWAIPWLEGDNQLWHFQPRVDVIRDQVKLARTMNMNGVIAIHWRTEETRVNFECFSRFAQNPDDTTSVEGIYNESFSTQCGKAAADDLTSPFAAFDKEQWQKDAASPEYYAYTPEWGRLDSSARTKLEGLMGLIDRTEKRTREKRFAGNLRWLKANIEFSLLLDRVGAHLEPAYRLKRDYVEGRLNAVRSRTRIEDARKCLEEAPMQALFTGYAARVRSRGELGVLSSMNQKLYGEFLGLKRFLKEVEH